MREGCCNVGSFACVYVELNMEEGECQYAMSDRVFFDRTGLRWHFVLYELTAWLLWYVVCGSSYGRPFISLCRIAFMGYAPWIPRAAFSYRTLQQLVYEMIA
jgi:hypothetical protein